MVGKQNSSWAFSLLCFFLSSLFASKNAFSNILAINALCSLLFIGETARVNETDFKDGEDLPYIYMGDLEDAEPWNFWEKSSHGYLYFSDSCESGASGGFGSIVHHPIDNVYIYIYILWYNIYIYHCIVLYRGLYDSCIFLPSFFWTRKNQGELQKTWKLYIVCFHRICLRAGNSQCFTRCFDDVLNSSPPKLGFVALCLAPKEELFLIISGQLMCVG